MADEVAVTDYEADSLRGRLEALRGEMNALVPGLGDLEVGAFDGWLSARRDAVLAEFWRS